MFEKASEWISFRMELDLSHHVWLVRISPRSLELAIQSSKLSHKVTKDEMPMAIQPLESCNKIRQTTESHVYSIRLPDWAKRKSSLLNDTMVTDNIDQWAGVSLLTDTMVIDKTDQWAGVPTSIPRRCCAAYHDAAVQLTTTLLCSTPQMARVLDLSLCKAAFTRSSTSYIISNRSVFHRDR